ncbi:MAG: fumarylacetoacetate hydrolase family protein [Afipia sp.]|nr:fumarylacetoacetate hydrolase family protein [Afipia sp.]
MKLATLKNGKPDGELVVVSHDLKKFARASDIAPTLQIALDNWAIIQPQLEKRHHDLAAGISHEPFDPRQALSPLPRAYQWCDGSVYEAHMVRMAKWIKKPVDPRFFDEPWMYQGASDGFLAPTEDIPAATEEWGIDYEGEIAVITTAVPYGATIVQAAASIALVMLCNDVSLRNIIPPELSKGFGFVQSKPASAFSPVAVTLDELGTAWRDNRLHGALFSYVNDEKFGDPDAGAMVHGFGRLIAHASRTRSLSPGSIIGGGTVASNDPARGTSCLAERRVMEILNGGEVKTPFLRHGDCIKLEMLDASGKSIFGAIEQRVSIAG